MLIIFEDKVKDVDKSQIILETVRRQMAQYQAEMEEQARIMKERKAFLEAEGGIRVQWPM